MNEEKSREITIKIPEPVWESIQEAIRYDYFENERDAILYALWSSFTVRK